MFGHWKDAFSLNKDPVEELIPTFPAGTSIPKTIHQTFRSPPWHDKLHENMEDLQRVNPTWTYRFYDYEARRVFIESVYGKRVLALYDSIHPDYGAARADLFRYLLLYKEGGLYLDMKSTTGKALDDVLKPDDVYLLSTWRRGRSDGFKGWGMHAEVSHLKFGEFQQWFIAAAPGHPFLKRVIETVLRNIMVYIYNLHSYGSYAVLRVTGPVPYTLAIEPLMQSYPYRMVDSEAELGLVYSVFDRDASRTHEKIFPHYSTLKVPLIRMSPNRALVSAAVGALKALSFPLRKMRRARWSSK